MTSLLYEITDLPSAPLDAAAAFYASELPEIRDDCDISPELDLVIVFKPAGHEHGAWRLAAVQELAREMAPRRVNGIVSQDKDAIVSAIAFLHGASGVTGQLLPLDGKGAGEVLYTG